jgi:hypothetical protein
LDIATLLLPPRDEPGRGKAAVGFRKSRELVVRVVDAPDRILSGSNSLYSRTPSGCGELGSASGLTPGAGPPTASEPGPFCATVEWDSPGNSEGGIEAETTPLCLPCLAANAVLLSREFSWVASVRVEADVVELLDFGQLWSSLDYEAITHHIDCETTVYDFTPPPQTLGNRRPWDSSPPGTFVPARFLPSNKPDISDRLILCFGAATLDCSAWAPVALRRSARTCRYTSRSRPARKWLSCTTWL